jgi:DNA-binding transcriptional ArsR family regulator
MMMREFIQMAAALADPARVRALLALRDGELCLCQIIDLLGLAPSTVSRHLNLLYQAKLVERRKQGRWMYFTLAGKAASPPVQQAIAWAGAALAADGLIKQDARRVKSLCRQDLVELCACYRPS